MPSYNISKCAVDLINNPLWQDLLEQMLQDCKDAFPSTAPEGLVKLQQKYRLIEELSTAINNRIAGFQEAG